MKQLLKLFLPISISLILSCSETVTESVDTPLNTNNQIINDSIGDLANPSFDITGAQYLLYTDSIIVKIFLKSLPDSLTVNKVNTPDNALEFQYSAIFDIGNDGDSDNDIQISASHFKLFGEAEVITELSDCFQVNVWERTLKGGSVLCSADAEFAENGVILSVKRNAHSKLSEINSSTDIFFTSSFYDLESHSDTLLFD